MTSRPDFAERRTRLAVRRAGLPASTQAELTELIAHASGGTGTRRVVPPRPVDRPAPLSFAQQRLWFLDQLKPGSAAYNMAVVVRITGPLRLDALEHSLNEIVRRHESLRTNFGVDDGEPIQIIALPRKLALPLVDLTGIADRRRQVTAQALARDEMQRAFDLSRDPLLRVTLIRIGSDEHLLVVLVHHAVADGWSIQLMVDELGRLYTAFCAGQPSPLPVLPIQYADYAHWQREWLRGSVLDAALSYWRNQLRDLPPVLDLPTDRPRPPVMTFRGATHGFEIGETLTDAVRAFSHREGVTLFMTLLASFQALLFRYSGHGDIAVGTPVAGRRWVETERLIGLFANTLVIRTAFFDNPGVRVLLGRVLETVLQAQTWQDLPFEKLVEELRPDRSLSHTPLFQTMFAMQNVPQSSIEIAGLRLGDVDCESRSEKFDMTLSVAEGRQGLGCSLSYSMDLFAVSTIHAFARHWVRLLEAMVTGPDRRVCDLPLLDDADRGRLLVEWNDTTRAYGPPASLHELFERQVTRTPNARALVAGTVTLTYRELNEQANAVAHRLRSLGVRSEVRVGVCMERTAEIVVALLGILKAGGAYVPLDPKYPTERLRFMLEDAGAPVTLTQEHLRPLVGAHAGECVIVDPGGSWVSGWPTENMAPAAAPGNLAYVIYTSGSTGTPKGVAIQHASAATLCRWAQEVFGPEQLACVLASTSICFDLSVFEIFAPLSCGGAVALVDNVLHLHSSPAASEITFVNTVPSAIVEVLRLAPLPRSVATVALAGEPLQERIVNDVYRQHTVRSVFNLYGPSEDTTYSTCALVEKHAGGRVSIGRPIANTQAYVLDRQLQPVPTGVQGELYLSGAGLARGYLGRPALTAEKWIPNAFGAPGERMYRTGDLARYRADGTLDFLGRFDHQVKIRGHRIELGEIERVIRTHPALTDGVVLAREDRSADRRLVAYIVSAPDSSLQIDELRGWLQAHLPEYMVPSAFVVMDELPLTPNGKVDRRGLPAPDTARPDTAAAFVAPRTPTEEVLAGIWVDVLGVPRVGGTDNFFSLGGHSLLATRIISRVRDSFRIELPVRAVFEAPTLAGLAHAIETAVRAGRVVAAPPLRPAPRDTLARLSRAQRRLWFLDRLSPGSNAYNLPTATELPDATNIAAVEQALSEVARRHEVLRTTFPSVRGEPIQKVGRAVPVRVPIVDLTGLGHDAREHEALRLAREEALRPFDLSRGPLLRARSLRLDGRRHVQLVTMHHIVSDGWSMDLLEQEMRALYESFSYGSPSTLADLPIQYADYAEWHGEWLEGAAAEAELAFWTDRLQGAPTTIELDTDYPRPATPSLRGATYSFAFGKDVSDALREFGRRESVTLFMTLMAAFQILLRGYTRQHDMLVGTPMAGRSRAELETLIGFFVNMVVLRADLRGNPTFLDVVRRVRESTVAAHAHQDLPFDRLVEALQPERGIGRNPLFQVVLAVQHAPATLPGVSRVTPHGATTGGADTKFDLEAHFWDTPDAVQGGFTYSPDLFDERTIARMAQQFERLLTQGLANPGCPLAAITPASEAELDQVLRAWNDTAAEYAADVCVHHLIEGHARTTPDAIALEDEHERITYRELDRRADAVAHYLREQGVGPEVLVAVCMERSPGMVIALLGILKAGGAYVPIDPAYPPDRVAYLLDDARAAIVVTVERYLAVLPTQVPTTVCLDRDWPAMAQARPPSAPVAVAGDHLAYVIYTSGSTGRPKGVMIRHAALANLVHWHIREYGLTGADRTLQLAGVGFDATVWEIWPYLAAGAAVFLPRASTSDVTAQFSRWVDERRISLAFLITPLAEAVLPALRPGLPLRALLVGGDRLHRLAHAVPYPVVNHYGPTETTVVATYGRVDAPSRRAPSIGRPIANTRIYILNDDLHPTPAGMTGEIYVAGDGVGRGYWRRADLTAARFVPDPFSGRPGARMYRTGDLGRYLSDGHIDYWGRIDQQVKIRGFRIELGEIVSVLKEHAGVREAAVAARGGVPGDTRLVAYVVPAEASAPAVAELTRHLERRVPPYMVPTAWVFLPELPLSANGKLDWSRLPNPEPGPASCRATDPAQTPAQHRLVEIWEDLLGVRPIGIRDDFFRLGGHSILAVQMLARIEEALGKHLPIAALFQGATIEQLSRVLGESSADARPRSPLVLIRPRGPHGADFHPTAQACAVGAPGLRRDVDPGATAPLVLVHAAGGHVLCYADLVRHLGADQPVHGLQSRFSSDVPAHLSIEEIAADYVACVKEAQPAGPYLLGGWSMGGVIAFEMARQLSACHDTVALLALIDSYAPNGRPAPADVAPALDAFALSLGFSPDEVEAAADEVARLSPAEQVEWMWREAARGGLIPRALSQSGLQALIDAYDGHARVLRGYTGGDYQGRVTLFRAAERLVPTGRHDVERADPLIGWQRLVTGGVDLHTVPGHHYTMLREPHVAALAERLQTCVEGVSKDLSTCEA